MSWINVAGFVIVISNTLALNLSSDFVMIYERTEVISYNPEYMSHVDAHNYKFNRTQAVTNGTLKVKKNLKHHFKFEVQAYKFMSNEYRYFPLRFSADLCETLSRDDFGVASGLCKYGNLSNAGCPYKKGTYQVCQYFVSGEKYPPHIPSGTYMIDIKLFEGSTEILFLQNYNSIKYKNFWQH